MVSGILMTPEEIVAGLEASGTLRWTGPASGRMAWRVFGSGPPVLLLHGGHGSWTHWLRNIENLARDHRLLIPDMPGYGCSGLPVGVDGPEAVAAIVVEGADEILGPGQRIAVAGFSFGGVIAGHIAQLRPDMVRRLVLIGAGGLGLYRPPMAEMSNWRVLPDGEERAAAHRRNLSILMIHDPERIDPLAVHLQSENARRTRFKSRPISATPTLRDALPATRAPLAGIWGREDATARGHLDQRRDLLRSFDPAAEFEIIEGAGHWIQYEATDAFNPILRDILSTNRTR